MNREQTTNLLRDLIPSFKREWTGDGGNAFNEEYGFLYHDDVYSDERIKGRWESRITKDLPFEIPDSFLEGIVIKSKNSGETLTSTRFYSERDYRKVVLKTTSFGKPYEHCYGTLLIDGVNWKDSRGITHCGYLGDFYQDPNYDPRVRGIWEVEVCRIITVEDINSRSDWRYYQVGDASPRFVSWSEMILTACWVTLMRVKGPVMLTGSPYSSDNKVLIQVDEKDNVKFFPYFYDNLLAEDKNLFTNE